MTEAKAIRWRPVGLIMSTAFCIGLSIGLFPALLSINVETRGYGASLNGLLAALHGIAGLAVGPFVPRLMARVGGLRAYVGATAVAAVAASLFVVFQDFEAWFVLRFVLGVGLGVQWIVSETWMNRVASGPRRGTVISIYVLILSLGLSIGPLIMAALGTAGPAPFLATSALLVLSCVPLLFLPQDAAVNRVHSRTLGIVTALLRKPSAMLAAAVDGFVFQAFIAFLPIYFLRVGSSEAAAIGMLNAFFIGGVVMQLAIGFLMDRFTPAAVLAGSSFLLLAGLVVIALPNLGQNTLWLVLFAMGGPGAAIFTAGLASVNDAFTVDEMSSGSAAFTMFWHVGGLSGPALAGFAMDWWSPYGFSAVVAAALLALAVTNAASLRHKVPA